MLTEDERRAFTGHEPHLRRYRGRRLPQRYTLVLNRANKASGHHRSMEEEKGC